LTFQKKNLKRRDGGSSWHARTFTKETSTPHEIGWKHK
jgi:hypothetical protein